MFQFSIEYSGCMRKTKPKKNVSGKEISAEMLQTQVVAPLTRCIEGQIRNTNELVELAIKRIQFVEDLIDIIAREIQRQSDSKG